MFVKKPTVFEATEAIENVTFLYYFSIAFADQKKIIRELI